MKPTPTTILPEITAWLTTTTAIIAVICTSQNPLALWAFLFPATISALRAYFSAR